MCVCGHPELHITFSCPKELSEQGTQVYMDFRPKLHECVKLPWPKETFAKTYSPSPYDLSGLHRAHGKRGKRK